MQLEIRVKLKQEKNMYQYLKENSYWVKELNRNSERYSEFVEAMKDLYHLRTTDKISDAIDNIDLISSFLGAFKA
ncbi:MAG: hypothetical protein HFH86_03090 [Bacilli bacterium]|jgi:hypothetical protein|nr:hypothetical protein [Bacilli bacterium]